MIPAEIEDFFYSKTKKDILLICGPTGSGKSSLALEIAKKYKEVIIINLDAYQVYKDIPICSASPSYFEKQQVPHYLFNYIEHDVQFSVGMYLKHLTKILNDESISNKIPILVGGSSLYIYSVLYGLQESHPIPDQIRNQAIKESNLLGIDAFFNKILTLMPELNGVIHKNDTKRLIRNYEFFLINKQSLRSYIKAQDNIKLDFKFTLHKILPPRIDLYEKSNAKILEMISSGAIDEVLALLPKWDQCKSIKTALLVPELQEYLTNKITLKEAIDKAQMNTRRFIKKQYCWLKNKI